MVDPPKKNMKKEICKNCINLRENEMNIQSRMNDGHGPLKVLSKGYAHSE